MAIPVVSELIQIFVGFWQNSPWQIKTLIFLGLATIFLTIFQVVYDTEYIGYCPLCIYKGIWTHRVLQPQKCNDAYTSLNNYSLAVCNDVDAEALTDCIQDNAHSLCTCRLNYTSQDARTGEYSNCQLICCDPSSLMFAVNFPLGIDDGCKYRSFSPDNTTNTTYYAYCLSHLHYNATQAEEAQATLTECRSLGFDYLNSTIIWGGTILTYLLYGMVWILDKGGLLRW